MLLRDHVTDQKPSHLPYHSAYGHQAWQNGDILEGFLPLSFMNLSSRGPKWCITAVPIAFKLSRMMSYLEGLIPIESHDPSITWFCIIPKQTKTVIYLLPQCLWPPNFVGWWLILRSFFPYDHMAKSRRLARSRGKLKTYLHYQNVYGHLTWQGVDIQWRAPTHNITGSFNHVFLWGRVTDSMLYLHLHHTNRHQTCQGGDFTVRELHS